MQNSLGWIVSSFQTDQLIKTNILSHLCYENDAEWHIKAIYLVWLSVD